MAKIYAMPNAAEWEKREAESYDQHFERTRKLMGALQSKADSLPAGEYVGALLSFGVADGSAVYYVQSLKPLVICHVPYMDAYRAHQLIEKGLTVAEVKRMVDSERRFAKMFSRRSA